METLHFLTQGLIHIVADGYLTMLLVGLIVGMAVSVMPDWAS